MAATYLLSLYPAMLGAFGMTATTVHALLLHTKTRYSIKDETTGEKLLSFPYDPKQVVPGKEDQVARAFRTHRAYENAKEWTGLTLPFLFCTSLYGASIPYVTEQTNRWVVGVTATGWCIGNLLFIQGYKESFEGRMTGFKLRTAMSRVYMYMGCLGLLCYGKKQVLG